MPLIVRRRLSADAHAFEQPARRAAAADRDERRAGRRNDLQLQGLLLGTDNDDVMVLFYRDSDGSTVRLFDTVGDRRPTSAA